MIFDGIVFRRRVAFPFRRQDMDQSWTVDFLDVLQRCDHFCDVVTVNGTDVLEPQALEKKTRRHQA